MYFRTEAAIDLDAVLYNFDQVRHKVSDNAKVLVVVKANAYGHGAVKIARFLNDKSDFFGVACIEEALELKHNNITKPILILGYVSPDLFGDVVKYDLRIPIFS